MGLSRFVMRKLFPELQNLGSPAWALEMVSVLSVAFIAELYTTETRCWQCQPSPGPP